MLGMQWFHWLLNHADVEADYYAICCEMVHSIGFLRLLQFMRQL